MNVFREAYYYFCCRPPLNQLSIMPVQRTAIGHLYLLIQVQNILILLNVWETGGQMFSPHPLPVPLPPNFQA